MARREHSRRELERKLTHKGLEQDDISSALDELADEGLQKDGRYADTFIRSRAARGYGPRRIEQELKQRGVEQSLVRSALQSAEVDWDELACDTRRKKFRGKPGDAQERAKQMRFLEYRGFDAAQIRQALKQAATDEDL